MSVQSVQRLQEPNFAISHKNNLNDSLQPHSAQLNYPTSSAPHQQWAAAFVDGQYFLTDPQSMQRLKNIQAQIQQQKKKLTKLQNDNQSLSHSFYSLQQEKGQKLSSKSFCGTEFNENIQISKKQTAKNQLQNQEDRYKEKIKNMEKEKHQMKKGMKQLQKHPENQVKLSSQKDVQVARSGHRESYKKQPTQIQKSRKTPRKSIKEESKDKSYHKSRIQQSIKDNLQMNHTHLELNPQQADNKIIVEKSMKSHHTAIKSIEVNENGSVQKSNNFLQPETNLIEKKSVKHSTKSKKVQDQIEDKVISQKPVSIKQSQKVHQKEFSINEAVNKSSHKQSRVTSKKQIQNVPQFIQSVQKRKSQQSKYQVKVIDIESVKSSHVKQAQNSDIKSVRSVHSHLIQQKNDDNKKSKRSSVLKNDNQQIKSKKTHRDIVENKSRVSHQEIIADQKFQKDKFIDQQLKSKKSALNDKLKSRKSHLHPQVSIQQDLKSQKSPHFHSGENNAQEVKSKKSYYQNFDNKSQRKNEEQKSKKSYVQASNNLLFLPYDNPAKSNKKEEQDLKSRKSSKIEEKQISVRKSSRAKSIRNSEKAQVQSKRSNYIQEVKSKKSQITNQKPESRVSQTSNKSYEPVANEIKFQNKRVQNSQSIQLKESSINQSSNMKIQIENNQLTEEHVQYIGEPNQENVKMYKKKNQTQNENQSEKKSKSFIIHSRNGSVKQRSEKNYIVSKSNRVSISKKHVQISSNNGDSVTKEQITRLYQQITFLKQKLKIIEDKQQQMEKMEKTFSKINSNELYQPVQVKEIEETQSPNLKEQIEKLNEIVFEVKAHPKLQIESSIFQVNTQEEIQKKIQMQAEADQKNKLNHQISRLKKIIRDMQIEKIRSIDYENELGQSQLLKKDSKNIDPKESRVQKESINTLEGMPTKKKFWVKSRLEDAGRIIKNSQIEHSNPIDISPRRLNNHRIRNMPNDQQLVEPEQLPFYSNNKRDISNLVKEAHKHSLIEKIHDKDRDFHHFVQSSRLFAEQPKIEQMEVNNQSSGLQKFSKIQVGNHNQVSNKINYSRLVQEFRKNNPEEQEVLPEIHLRDIKIPQLPNTPTAEMTQQQLLALAKEVYQIFGINIDQQVRQLCVKKYKNCVVFTVSNSSDCILWHFSGKFYMGGWKTGEPGEGEKNGEGLQIVPQKHAYKGQFLNGKKNGTGIIKLVNGNIYDGQWIDGAKNGRGVYFDSATKVIYSGEWKDGKKDGQGFLKLSDKEYYYGTFVKSVKQGFGSEVFINGDRYKGEYKNGKFHGKGKYVWANGSCYQGQFVDGARHGQGSWKSAKNNGDIYIGTYQNDKKNGYGRYVWANGCMYQGGFTNDVKHGKGRLTYQDGKQIKGIWQQGNLVNTQNEKKPIEHQDQPLRRSLKAYSFGYHPATSRRF